MAKDEPEVVTIGDLVPDPENARKHTARNIGMIVDALQEVGAARSIVIDENNVVLAGNGVLEGAGQIDMTKVKVIEANGNEIVAVRRRGLSAEQKKRLALYDNRTSELAKWDVDVLKNLDEGELLGKLWSDTELQIMFEDVTMEKQIATGGNPNWDSAFATDYTADAIKRAQQKQANPQQQVGPGVCPTCGRPLDGGKSNGQSVG